MTPKPPKNPHAVALGRKGGKAAAKALTPEQRTQRAKTAILARWTKKNTVEATQQ